MKEPIINYVIEKIQSTVIKEGSYVINNPSKLKTWLIDLLLRLKVIKHEEIAEVMYSRVEIKREKIMDLIRDLYDDIYYSTCEKPRKIIIGYNKMRQLDIEMLTEMRFSMPIELSGREGKKIFGMEIILNPRIDGLVLI